MNQHIHCLIDNCHYWSQGNVCKANEIVVTSDQLGSSQPDRVDARMANQLPTARADSCMSTCCKTFVDSGSDKINADGIKRMS